MVVIMGGIRRRYSRRRSTFNTTLIRRMDLLLLPRVINSMRLMWHQSLSLGRYVLHRSHLRIRRNLTVTTSLTAALLTMMIHERTHFHPPTTVSMSTSTPTSAMTMTNIHNSRHTLPHPRLRSPTTNLRIQSPVERRELVDERRMQMRLAPRHHWRLDDHGVLFGIFGVLEDLLLVLRLRLGTSVVSVVRMLMSLSMSLILYVRWLRCLALSTIGIHTRALTMT